MHAAAVDHAARAHLQQAARRVHDDEVRAHVRRVEPAVHDVERERAAVRGRADAAAQLRAVDAQAHAARHVRSRSGPVTPLSARCARGRVAREVDLELLERRLRRGALAARRRVVAAADAVAAAAAARRPSRRGGARRRRATTSRRRRRGSRSCSPARAARRRAAPRRGARRGRPARPAARLRADVRARDAADGRDDDEPHHQARREARHLAPRVALEQQRLLLRIVRARDRMRGDGLGSLRFLHRARDLTRV